MSKRFKSPLFYIFLEPLTFGNIFWQVSPNEMLDKNENILMWQSYFFMSRRILQNNVIRSFYKEQFLKQRQAAWFPLLREGLGEIPQLPKSWLVPHVPVTVLLQKCLFCNFFAAFGHFAQIVSQQIDLIWETLRLRSDLN